MPATMLESALSALPASGSSPECDCLAPQPSSNWIDGICCLAVQQHLGRLRGGQLQLKHLAGTEIYGQETDDRLVSDWSVIDRSCFRQIVAKGSLGLADSYIDGHWTSQDLTALLRILCRSLTQLRPADRGIRRVPMLMNRLIHRLQINSVKGSRRNIAAHYDLSDPFFELFLDPTMSYSAAYFSDPATDLHAASIAKFEQLCRKLSLDEEDQLLEIGTGWGGFAIHAAGHYGCHVTSTTISRNQFQSAKARVAAARLAGQVRLLETDYRDLRGQYDKLVSIEMIEAVGEKFHDLFFSKCNELLRPHGRFVLQAIVMPEHRYPTYRKSVDFIQKYIFPGGFLPSVSAICASIGRTSKLNLQSVEDLSPHYARTLSHWRTNFLARLDDVRKLGFDDRFIRMWEYYLCYCEAAFEEQAVQVVQMVWDKPGS